MSVNIVWIPMLEGDTQAAAITSSAIIQDPRVAQFYDGERRLGATIAQGLGSPSEIAWDIYLFYPPGRTWDALPPPPVTWMHQLSAPWADPARRHCGGDLVAQLHRATQRFMPDGNVE